MEEGKALAAAPGLAGAKLAYLDGEEARRLEPRLSPRVLGALWCDRFGQVDSYRYTLALAQAAERSGAQFQTRQVTGLERRAGKLTGLRTTTGVIPCERAVLAMGAWSAEARDRLIEHALSIIPSLEAAQVVGQFAGPRPQSQDGLPIMGPAPTLSGVYLNTGHGHSGILLAAASGRHVAEMVIQGSPSLLKAEPYVPMRFVAKQQ
ncbi:MAG: FAD-dependent oxidoreductase [Chloroflexi bacterium]|nr:FAD-dependent oxidoreductase [Chloroflexota bacterium]